MTCACGAQHLGCRAHVRTIACPNLPDGGSYCHAHGGRSQPAGSPPATVAVDDPDDTTGWLEAA